MLNKKILNLALPNIVSNITVPLLGMVDLAILGHLDSVDYLGAVALGAMIFSFIYSIFGFLRMGTTGFAAKSYGERNLTESGLVFLRAMFVALGISILLIVLQVPIDLISFSLIEGDSPRIQELAQEYFYIRIWAAPATMSLFVLNGWFIGMQNAKTPLAIAITINILNIFFNILFVFILGMRSDGVAWGTLIAQYSGFIIGMFFVYRYYRKIFREWRIKAILKLKKLKEFATVNSDIFIRSFAIMIVLSFFTIQSYAVDKETLAINTILLQYFLIFAYFMDGFANAAEALTGKYIGAGDDLLLKKTINLLFRWGLGLSIPFTLVYLFGGDFLLRILTSNEEVIQQASPYLIWMGIVPIISFAAFLWDGIYVGATASKGLRNSMLIAAFVFFAPTWYFLEDEWGNHALWFAFSLFLISRGVFQTLYAQKEIFRKNNFFR